MKNIIKARGSVYFNEGSWAELSSILENLNPTKVFILTDTNTKTHCLELFLKNVTLKKAPVVLSIPFGEAHKTITTCIGLWNELSEKGADRNSLLINLGGGVVTDLGGFVASTFKRGIKYINVPTSLLAMVDASVGGKTGVDLGTIKNQIGVINFSEMVLVDSYFLNTLPENEINSGMAEMLKHGLIQDEKYWEAMTKVQASDYNNFDNLIYDSILIKNKVTTQDPNEDGLRKTLNYGHTLGHAIESYCLDNEAMQTLLHGEAIAAGMIMEGYLSVKTCGLSERELNEIKNTFCAH